MPKVLKINVDVATDTAAAAVARLDAKFKDAEKAAGAMEKAIAQVEKNNRAAATAIDKQASAVDGLTNKILGYVSVSAVIAAVKNTAAWGDELQTLSRRMSTSVIEVQKMDFAAKSNGTSIDQVANAIGQMNQRLAGDDKSAIAGLRRLHLSFNDVRDDAPIEAFLNIAHAMQKLPDPMEQARASLELFGVSGRQLFPLLTADLDATMKKAEDLGLILSPTVVRQAADLDTSIGILTTRFKALVAEGLEPAMPLFDSLAKKDFSGIAHDLSNIAVSIATLGRADLRDMEGILHNIGDAATGQRTAGAPKPPGAPALFGPGSGVPRPELNNETALATIRADLTFIEFKEREAKKAADEFRRTQHELEQDFHRVREAAREAFDAEISNAFMSNLKQIKAVTENIRDDFASLAFSGKDAVTGLDKLRQFQINEAAARAKADIDPRAENAAATIQQLEAQRQLSLLLLKKDTQGVTDELQQQFLIFRQTYQDVLKGLPEALEAQVPAIAAASGEIRDTMTSDIETVGAKTTQTFQMMAVVAHKTSTDLRAEATQIENDLADMATKGQQGPFGYTQFQQQTAQRKRTEADYAARQESYGQPWGLPHFAAGVRGYGGGYAVVGERGPEVVRLPSGSDVIPSGRGLGGSISVTIDARGATFSNDAAIEQLADRVQRKLAPLFTRYGG